MLITEIKKISSGRLNVVLEDESEIKSTLAVMIFLPLQELVWIFAFVVTAVATKLCSPAIRFIQLSVRPSSATLRGAVTKPV